MKKILLIALLLISIGFAPCLCGGIELQIPAADLAALLVRPLGSALFWHTWDLVLDHLLARSLPNPLLGEENSLSAVSISQVFVRRIVERELTAHKHPANDRHVLQYQVNNQLKEMSS